MSELDASNDTERSNKIEILISTPKTALIHMTLDLVSIIVPKIKIGVFYPKRATKLSHLLIEILKE